VRYNTNAVYLGTPGENQQCPAELIGQTDTLSVDASGSASQPGRPVIDLQSAEVGGQVAAQPGNHPGLSVTATYGPDPGTVRQILRSVRDTRTHAPVAIHQSAVAPPAVPAAVPAAAPASAAAGLDSPAASPERAKASKQRVTLTPWERAWLRKALRWYPASWYLRARERYLGERAWTPAAWYPQAQSQPISTSPSPEPAGETLPPNPAPTNTAPSKTMPTKAVPTKTAPTKTAPTKTAPTQTATSKPSPAPSATPSSTVPATHLKATSSTPMLGFDTCTAPSLQAMQAWRRSYSVAAIYIGGAEMACDYGNLSASWVKAVKAMGWSLIPLYVGLQAPCNSFSSEIQPSQAAPEGTSAAKSAVADAQSFGLGSGAPIYFDMEAYDSGNGGCRNSVLSFLNQWTREIHALGYVSGVYSSAASGAEDVGNATSVYGHPMAKPDAMWFALWDNKANVTGTPYLLNSWWNPDRRIKQYQGGHSVKVGGIKLNIDSDWVEGPVY
jgi:hypothetical protein